MTPSVRTLEYFQQMRLLTLNLHCRQETRWRENLEILAHFIAEQNIDVIALQECAQPRGAEHLSDDNDVVVLQHLLETGGLKYHVHWTINHIGFETWYEGLGLLSSFPFESVQEIHISRATDINDWQTRRVQLAAFKSHDIPIQLCNLHLGIEGNGAEELQRLVEEINLSNTIAVGDFNIPDTSPEYRTIRDLLQTPDVYAEIVGRSDPTFFPGADGWGKQRGKRIDYVFGHRACAIQRVFTGDQSPRISDHMGLLVDFEF